MIEESIYNIVPINPELTPKKSIYHSKYPYDIPPTGSTFAIHTTSKPGVSNLSGDFAFNLSPHTSKGISLTFGQVKGARKSLPQSFQKKATGTMGSNDLPPIRQFSYDCSHKKQRVPRVGEKPILGLKSERNFIVSNAVDAILSQAKKSPKTVDWRRKKDFGKIPKYLTTIKNTLNEQFLLKRTLQQESEQKRKFLSQMEVERLRHGLKQKWNTINREYQKMTHLRLFDTTGLKRKKDWYEVQLDEIEKDIKKLNKGYILVEND